jgi:hypothetical protein
MKRNGQTAIVAGIVVAGAIYAASQSGINTRPFTLGLSVLCLLVLVRRYFADPNP